MQTALPTKSEHFCRILAKPPAARGKHFAEHWQNPLKFAEHWQNHALYIFARVGNYYQIDGNAPALAVRVCATPKK
ncbi:MAG: hypothetical protein IJS32_03160 [Kiritimatiellae bacterium]|nr:hypothetical protein [Kiritimatiellia bacterium]